jgi:tyrosine-protein phosphatase YwqE
MCFQNKKTLLRSGFLNHFTDYHTHILPGVDDGIKTIEESLELLQLFEEEGVKEIVLTPHIMDEYPQNNPHFLKARFAELQGVYKGTIELRLGAEYMIDSKFGEHLQKGDLLTIKENYLLVETSYAFEPQGFMAAIKEAKDKGYQIVLAHPERYSYMTKEHHRQLRQLCVFYQLNLPSILGFYGPKVYQNALELLESNAYHFIGTDIHRVVSFQEIYAKRKVSGKLLKRLETRN